MRPVGLLLVVLLSCCCATGATIYAPFVDSPTHPELRLWSDGTFSVPDPHPDQVRACKPARTWLVSHFTDGAGMCSPAGLAYVCFNATRSRWEGDFHFWTKGEPRCTYEVQTHSEMELRRGVMMHGQTFWWDAGDVPEEPETREARGSGYCKQT